MLARSELNMNQQTWVLQKNLSCHHSTSPRKSASPRFGWSPRTGEISLAPPLCSAWSRRNSWGRRYRTGCWSQPPQRRTAAHKSAACVSYLNFYFLQNLLPLGGHLCVKGINLWNVIEFVEDRQRKFEEIKTRFNFYTYIIILKSLWKCIFCCII